MAETKEQFAARLNALLDELLQSFDQLRDQLVEDLTHYESQLSAAIEEVPEWLAIEPNQIRDLFRPTERTDLFIGPRMVADVALDVESFVGEWIGDYDAAVKIDFDEPTIREYRDRCAGLERSLVETEKIAKETTSSLVETLGSWLDQILDELQLERDEDERALADLVTDGSVDKGKSQLKENADVWEHYRKRAERLTETWERLEALGFRGADRTIDGLGTLRNIVSETDRALTKLYPELDVTFEPISVPDRVEPDERQTLELDREEPAGSHPHAQDAEDHDRERQTVELSRVATTVEADRPQHTQDEPTDEAKDRAREPTSDSDDVPAKVEDEGKKREPFWASRTVKVREPIPSPEVGLVWGLPGVFFAVVIVAAIAHATGQEGAENPFERFAWLWPVCVVFGAEMIIMPIIRGWRVNDPGGGKRAGLVRFRETEDELQMSMFDDCVKVGPRIARPGDATLHRWEQFSPAAIGWALTLDSTVIAATERNVTRWEDSTTNSRDLSGDAWHVSIDNFWEICEILGVSR